MPMCVMNIVGRVPVIVPNRSGGIKVRAPAVDGMIFHGVPLLPQEPANVPRLRPLFSVANLDN